MIAEPVQSLSMVDNLDFSPSPRDAQRDRLVVNHLTAGTTEGRTRLSNFLLPVACVHRYHLIPFQRQPPFISHCLLLAGLAFVSEGRERGDARPLPGVLRWRVPVRGERP
jgi:hypothetical protein